jgi:hypothetical protein
MDIISYFETFINSKTLLEKDALTAKLKEISEKHFRNIVKIKAIDLPYGGWEIKAKGLRNQWVKAYVIDEGYTFKIYWYNSNEFLRWVATIVMHELALEFDAEVFSGRNLEVGEPEDAWYDTFKGYIEHIKVVGPSDAKQNLMKNTIPRKIRKAFDI